MNQATAAVPVTLGGEARDAAVLFVDLQGSTTLAENRDPTEVVAVLNQFFAIVVDVVAAHDGWVNKFEGDAALCIFGAPLPDPQARPGRSPPRAPCALGWRPSWE